MQMAANGIGQNRTFLRRQYPAAIGSDNAQRPVLLLALRRQELASAWVLFAFIFACTLLPNRLQKRWVHYETGDA